LPFAFFFSPCALRREPFTYSFWEAEMEKWLEGLEPIVVRQDLQVPYRYSMGATTSKFFIEMRDNRKILGIRCPACKVVYVPPRTTCGRCFSQLDEWVEVGDRGTLETYTRVHYSTPVQPVPAPFYYGIVKLDGADTGLAHLVGGLKGKEPKIGMRLQAVFKEDRQGNMLDISYFQPAEEKKGPRSKVQGARLEKKDTRRKAQGARLKAQGSRRKAQGARQEKKGEKGKGKGQKAKGKSQKSKPKANVPGRRANTASRKA
jgi:uncharacterized OB-fold protein